ncbi:MAG: aminotransferase class V-fold PLP-dependent enzyme [Clostridia bacterium]|nr:aminotransferase class V-fold PLP-dependent enzyme [Clostridia bacterium]
MIYFDNAATTYPKPACVTDALCDFIKERGGNPGRGGHVMSMKAAETVFECRKKLASFFGCGDPSLVCFTGGCTEALNAAIRGLIKPEDVVITDNVGHNSVRRPLIASGAKIRYFNAFDGEAAILEQIDDGIKKGGRAVVCTCASNVFPLVLPVAQIGALCRERGVPFIADGAQTAGISDVSANDCDVLCVPAHKGLYGITGCGAMIFSPGCDPERFPPLLYGGSGVDSRDAGMPDRPPERYEAGTLPTAAIAALSAGLDFVLSTGAENIKRREYALSGRIYGAFRNNGSVVFYHPAPGSLLCFNVRGKKSEQTAALLDKYGVCARAGLHCAPDAHKYTAPDGTGAVRISFSVFNTEEEADAFCDILEHISRS